MHLFLAAKGVKAEYIYISLQNKPEWYLEIYPKGQVPFFEQNGHRLGESAIICGKNALCMYVCMSVVCIKWSLNLSLLFVLQIDLLTCNVNESI